MSETLSEGINQKRSGRVRIDDRPKHLATRSGGFGDIVVINVVIWIVRVPRPWWCCSRRSTLNATIVNLDAFQYGPRLS